MTKKHSTKRSLIASILMLCLCFTSFVGTTYAWFTDEVTSGSNIIKSGSLDIVLEYWDGSKWIDAEGKVIPFVAADGRDNDSILWEPGCTYELAPFRVRNAGNLTANILIRLNGIDGDEKLMEVIELKTKVTNIPASLLTGSAANVFGPLNNAELGIFWGTPDGNVVFDHYLAGAGKITEGTGHTDTSPEFTIFGHMAEDAGNEYQNLIMQGISITVLATQGAYESDSFNHYYDINAPYPVVPEPVLEVSSFEYLKAALEEGETEIALSGDIVIPEGIAINNDLKIDGRGHTISRGTGADAYTGNMFTVANGKTLTLTDATVDGGAVWTGAIDPVLQRGTTNSGIVASGMIIATTQNAHIVLENGAVIQNNDGAYAIHLETRKGNTLTINGGEIINNRSAGGAIWGGGETTLNSGKINGNQGGNGGAFRIVTNVGTVLTMNGGEINHNVSDSVGGAIWAGSSPSNNVYVFNGGEMAYNYSYVAGGAMYAGYRETVKIGGTFKLHDNSAPAASAIRFHSYATLIMTGGEIYNNGDNSLFLLNNAATITGGRIADNFTYAGGLDLRIGEADIEGVITFDLSTVHNTAKLAASFNSFKFIVNEASANFAAFNFEPADGYVYTAGDEAKLVCMNAGYSTYWDAAAGVFKIKAN